MKTHKNSFSCLFITLSLVLSLASSCSKDDRGGCRYPFPPGLTTLDRTLVPITVSPFPTLGIHDAAKFDQYGYGRFEYGPGIPCQKRTDLMPAGYTGESVRQTAELLRFFTMTDVHITDKESPCQAIVFAPRMGDNAHSCYSPLMLYTTQVFDAAVQTINKLDDAHAFDLGLALGDLANSTQKNELDWFIKIMDGGTIIPSSGQQKPGTLPDYQQPFTAAGLHSHIPWYAALGNHDHFWVGSKPMNNKIRNALLGTHILQIGWALADSSQMDSTTYTVGTIDGSTKYGDVIGCGRTDTLGVIPDIAADPERRSLSADEWIAEFRTSNSKPYGHGFVQSNPNNLSGACYSFKPKSDVPIKIIVLDDTQADDDPLAATDGIYGHGELPAARYHWLMDQLQAGQDSNELMIIAAHVPIKVAPSGSPFSWIPVPGCYTDENDLVSQLQQFPNLILWVSGHRHLNNVTALPSTDPAHPEKGFWEVETKSIREFPEEFRTYDIVRNSDNSISIITTDVDADINPGSIAAIGRKYAIASNQIYKMVPVPLESGSVVYNAELYKVLTPVMKDRIRNCGKLLNQ